MNDVASEDGRGRRAEGERKKVRRELRSLKGRAGESHPLLCRKEPEGDEREWRDRQASRGSMRDAFAHGQIGHRSRLLVMMPRRMLRIMRRLAGRYASPRGGEGDHPEAENSREEESQQCPEAAG